MTKSSLPYRSILPTLLLVFTACGGSDGTGPGDGPGGGDPPPAAPSDLVAFPQSPDRLAVSWTDNASDERGFEVQRSLQAGSGFETVGTADADSTRFVDTGLSAGTTYHYRVRATGPDESSGFTGVAQATTLPAREPGSDFDCERMGYPCTWPEVDPAVFDESDRLGDEGLQRFDDGESVAVVGDEPKSKRALVLSVYQYDFGAWDDGADVAALLQGARGYEGRVEYYANTSQEAQVSKEQFKNWDLYQAVHVSSHGTQVCRDGECTTVILGGATSREVILGGDERGADLVKIEYGERDFGASTDFFKAQYPQGLPDTIVFVSACQTSKGDDLAEALAGSGGAFLGWTETVWFDTAREAALAFFRTLVEKGVPATSGFLSLREGDDLTIDRPNSNGSIATLDIYRGGDDLRIREVVFPRNPLTKQDLPQDAPYPVVGTPEDGNPDRVPYLVKVDGVEGEPGGFTVHVTVNGFSADPRSLAEGEVVEGDPNVWQLKGTVDVPFDAQQGQEVDVDVRVELPEGGESRWDESPELGNPEIRFRSSIESVGGGGPVVRLFSEVEAEFELALDEELESLEGEDVLRYPTFELTVPAESGCSLGSVRTTEGVFQVVDGHFEVGEDDEPVVPDELVILIPGGVGTGPQEFYTVFCPEGSGTLDSIHYFAGFYSFHGGQLCDSANEVDQAAGGVVIRDWTPGSGEVWARRDYDRTCRVEEVTFTERTTIELLLPDGGG